MGNTEVRGVVFPNPDDLSSMKTITSQSEILNLKKEDIHHPLTEKEVLVVTKSWKAVSKNMVNAGVAMFLKMFKNNPEVQHMFEQFRTIDNESDLMASQVLEAHALVVMHTFDEAITSLDDEKNCIDMLLTTGKYHRRFEEITPPSFWAMEQPFLDVVKETLVERYTPDMDRIYRKAITFILSVTIVGFLQAEGRWTKAGSSKDCPSKSTKVA